MDYREQVQLFLFPPYFDFTRLPVHEQFYAWTLMQWFAGPAMFLYSLGSFGLLCVILLAFVPELGIAVDLAALPPVFWLLLATSAPIWLAGRIVLSLVRTGAMPPYPIRTTRACWVATVLAGLWLISLYPLYAEFQASRT